MRRERATLATTDLIPADGGFRLTLQELKWMAQRLKSGPVPTRLFHDAREPLNVENVDVEIRQRSDGEHKLHGELARLAFWVVSFDMFVFRFRDGGTVPMPSAAFQVFLPHVDHAEPDLGFWHVRATDGGEAEIYPTVEPETFNSLMITNFSGGAVLDLLAEFVRQADAVVMPAGGPAMLAAETQRRHLPGEFQGEAVVVLNGRDIEESY